MAEQSIKSFIDTIAAKANIEPAAAETAVGTILSAIQQEGDAAKVAKLFDQVPGAADLAREHQVVVGSGSGLGGALSSLAGKFVGENAGVIVAALAQIEATNLSVQQIKDIGSALVSYLKDNVDPKLVNSILNEIPGLRDHLA
jgi:Protein of unknown function VcgC/VcgE (DUF2780)